MIAFIRNPNASVSGLAWRGPTDGEHEDGCLQMAADEDGGVFLRDSADPSKVLAFTTEQFAAFCGAVCAGRYRDILPGLQ